MTQTNPYSAQYLNTPEGRAALSTVVGANLTELQIAQALGDFASAILPYPETFPVFGFSAVNVLVNQKIQVDGGYALIVAGISALMTEGNTDIDVLINTIAVNSTTSLIGSNPLPVKMITQFTGLPVPFPFTAPPASTISAQVQNGSVTATNNVYLTLWTLRIPTSIIQDIKNKFSL